MSIKQSSWLTVFAKAALGVSTMLLVIAAFARFLSVGEGSAQDPKAPKSVARVKSGIELIAVFIGSSTCGASAHPGLPSALIEIRSALTARARVEGKRFVYIGVALDEKPETGLAFLKPFGPFDEVLAGGSWFGTGAVDFLIRGAPGPLGLPQLLVIEREVKAEKTSVSINSDKVIVRRLGFEEIGDFAASIDSLGVIR